MLEYMVIKHVFYKCCEFQMPGSMPSHAERIESTCIATWSGPQMGAAILDFPLDWKANFENPHHPVSETQLNAPKLC